ncbi:MAG: hypothetical protein R2747_03710 [Pyrinomonadaceae bacterium]
MGKIGKLIAVFLILFGLAGSGFGQKSGDEKKKSDKEERSIGGEEHDSNIYGVTIGMDVSTALEAVFRTARRKPGQEKPDAMKKEGENKADIRVVYKELPKGELQILFAGGKYVKEIILQYEQPIQYSDLRLPPSGDVGAALGGQRYDDRYTVGYTDSQKVQGVWWRDEKTDEGFQIRVIFTSTNRLKNSQFGSQKILQKAIFVTPGDEKAFASAMEKRQQ